MTATSKKQLTKFIEKINILSDRNIFSTLNKTVKDYRPYNPGWYLYRMLNRLRKKGISIFSDEYLELVYVTLSAWNMNSRAARLNEFEKFKDIIRDNKKLINSLDNYQIDKLTEPDLEIVIKTLKKLFFNMKKICLQSSKVVTFSKCLHFLLPNLVVPVDGRYTLSFFKKSPIIPKELEKQFELYKNMFLAFVNLSNKIDFSKYLNQRWNENVPKVMDNLIIGYMKLK
tara:strand:- start:6174 stop:6857 length:684 start_codon:yes stop_codon:yes gene_type:complete